jgi:hypothetical protein
MTKEQISGRYGAINRRFRARLDANSCQSAKFSGSPTPLQYAPDEGNSKQRGEMLGIDGPVRFRQTLYFPPTFKQAANLLSSAGTPAALM